MVGHPNPNPNPKPSPLLAQAALYDLGLPREHVTPAQLHALYDAVGVRGERIKYVDLHHVLLPRLAEMGPECHRRLSLWGATERSDPAADAAGGGRPKSPKGGKKGGGKKGGGASPQKDKGGGQSAEQMREAAEVCVRPALNPGVAAQLTWVGRANARL